MLDGTCKIRGPQVPLELTRRNTAGTVSPDSHHHSLGNLLPHQFNSSLPSNAC
jgi:hypothetical protein